MKKLAKVMLGQAAINRLCKGQSVTIRFEEHDLEMRFDPLARIGSGSLEDMIAEQLQLRKRG